MDYYQGKKFSGTLTVAILDNFIKASLRQSSPAWFQCTLTYYLSKHDKKLPWSHVTRHQIIADYQDDPADLFSLSLIALRQRSFYSIGNHRWGEKSTLFFSLHNNLEVWIPIPGSKEEVQCC